MAKINFTGMKESEIKEIVRNTLITWAITRELPEGITIEPEDITRVGNSEYSIHIGDYTLPDGTVNEVCGNISLTAKEYVDKTYTKKDPTFTYERLIEGDIYEEHVLEAKQKAEDRKKLAQANKAKREAEAKAVKERKAKERAERLAKSEETVKEMDS